MPKFQDLFEYQVLFKHGNEITYEDITILKDITPELKKGDEMLKCVEFKKHKNFTDHYLQFYFYEDYDSDYIEKIVYLYHFGVWRECELYLGNTIKN